MLLFSPPRLARVVRSLCLLLCAAMSSAAFGATQTQAPPDLRRAVADAWQRHPAARATDATLAAAEARAQAAARYPYNPELELESEKEGTERRTTAGVSLTVDVSGKRRARSDAAQATLEVAEAQALLRRREFATNWLVAWADRRSSAERVAIGERRVALLTRFTALADKQFAVGDISSLERDLALLARDEAQAEFATLLADQAEAEAAFQSVGGVVTPATDPAQAARTLPTPGPLVGTPWQSLPEWRIAQAEAVAAERGVRVAQRDRILDPTVGLTGGRVDTGSMDDRVIGVAVTVPLPVLNGYRHEVTAAQRDADAAHAEAERVTMELQARARRSATSYAAVRAAWDRWSASRGTDVERRADLLERLWRAGELSTADYLLQLNQTLDTALAGAELDGRLWRLALEYLAATGQLERWLGWDGANGDTIR
jgi:cobalt-zinc-cadmium efflux system outer membrane protein